MAAKTAKECLQHLNAPYAKCHCVNHLQQRIVGTVAIAVLPKKKRQEKKKNTNKNNALSRGKLKCRNSASLVMLH